MARFLFLLEWDDSCHRHSRLSDDDLLSIKYILEVDYQVEVDALPRYSRRYSGFPSPEIRFIISSICSNV